MKSLFLFFILLLSRAAGASGNGSGNFRASKTSGTTPLAVFLEPYGYASTSYRWDFGNGFTSTDKEPTATFLKPGTYVIKLLVNNGAQRDSSFMCIEVKAREDAPTTLLDITAP
jgi:PKD repeat protein